MRGRPPVRRRWRREREGWICSWCWRLMRARGRSRHDCLDTPPFIISLLPLWQRSRYDPGRSLDRCSTVTAPVVPSHCIVSFGPPPPPPPASEGRHLLSEHDLAFPPHNLGFGWSRRCSPEVRAGAGVEHTVSAHRSFVDGASPETPSAPLVARVRDRRMCKQSV